MENLKKIIKAAISALNEAGEVKYRLVETTREEYGFDTFSVEIYSSEFKKPVIRESSLLSGTNHKEDAYIKTVQSIVLMGIDSANVTYKGLSKTHPQKFF